SRRHPTATLYPYTTLFRSPNAQKKWNLVGTGQINYNKFDLGEVDVVVNIEQTGIERRVLNMKGIVVDLETQESENNSALPPQTRSEEHTSELQSRENLVCR